LEEEYFTLEKNGCKHMFFPLEEMGFKEEASLSILLMSGKDLLKEVKKD